MKAKALFLAASLAACSFAASADTLYNSEVYKHQTTFTSNRSFSEVYDFYLDPVDFPDGSADVAWAFTELKLKDIINIDFQGVNVYEMANCCTRNLIWSKTPAWTVQGPADVLSFDGVIDLQVGKPHFQLEILGTVVGNNPTFPSTGSTKGSYSFEISAVPVPEPETYGLMLAGLAVVAFSLNRRTEKNKG